MNRRQKAMPAVLIEDPAPGAPALDQVQVKVFSEKCRNEDKLGIIRHSAMRRRPGESSPFSKGASEGLRNLPTGKLRAGQGLMDFGPRGRPLRNPAAAAGRGTPPKDITQGRRA